MEDNFLHPGYTRIPQSYQEFYSTDQKFMQQQYPTTPTYSTYPNVLPQHYRQSLPYPQITDRENTSLPTITFQGDQSNTTFQPPNNETAIHPLCFQFFNHRQSNPIFTQLKDILAEDWLQANLPSTLIKTVTKDCNDNAYSVSCQKTFKVHKSHPATQSNYTACSQILPNSVSLFYNSQSASTSKCVSAANHVSTGLCYQPLQQYGPSVVAFSGSTSPRTSASSSKSHNKHVLYLTTTPDLNVSSASLQEQK
ncbi:uncharacterized protein LOC130051542 [Ostrea edulis]|uniref:uncharacterized protein LOC130051542 n=1 Tax=Ostrea edulis TaxID=37623 RepID=UPI0024AF0392|nr:uncharacterized protein LOC130051542 [Ostrea edulis]